MTNIRSFWSPGLVLHSCCCHSSQLSLKQDRTIELNNKDDEGGYRPRNLSEVAHLILVEYDMVLSLGKAGEGALQSWMRGAENVAVRWSGVFHRYNYV